MIAAVSGLIVVAGSVLISIGAALLLAAAWPKCPDCGRRADLFEGRCIACFRARLHGGNR